LQVTPHPLLLLLFFSFISSLRKHLRLQFLRVGECLRGMLARRDEVK
jgi:hypothetical protein